MSNSKFLLLYKLINWYTKQYSFPHRGFKYFYTFLKATGNASRRFLKKLHNGVLILVNPSEHIQQQLFWYGYYEKKYILTWESFVHEDSVVLDIGSNIGYYALVAAKKAVRGQVFAFEPSPPSFLQLQENIGVNALKNIRAEPLAAGEKTENRTFYIAEEQNSGMSGFTRPGTGKEISIPTVRMDEWFKLHSIRQLDLVKIDIEGAELGALNGMRSLLEQFHPVLMIEVQDELLNRYGHTKEDVFQFLRELNYTPYFITSPTDRIPLDKATEDDLVLFM